MKLQRQHPFRLVPMQYSMQYTFESASKPRRMMENVSEALFRRGGGGYLCRNNTKCASHWQNKGHCERRSLRTKVIATEGPNWRTPNMRGDQNDYRVVAITSSPRRRSASTMMSPMACATAFRGPLAIVAYCTEGISDTGTCVGSLSSSPGSNDMCLSSGPSKGMLRTGHSVFLTASGNRPARTGL